MSTSLQPPTERIALKGHTPLSRTTIHGWPAIFFGAVFALMGSPILAIGMAWLDYPKASIHAPLWVIGLCGGMFVACGIWLMVHGIKGLHRQWNLANGKQQLPQSPWLWDYPWHASGITDNKFKSTLQSLIAIAAFGAFLAPFNWIAFVSDEGGIFWKILTGLFDVIIVLGVGGYLLKTLRQYWAFGNGRISFGAFPFFLGQTMALTVEGLPENLDYVELTIRCIEEAYEIRQREGGRKRESVVVCYQIYQDIQTFRGELVNETGQLRCSWHLPDETHLTSTPSERPATFWELEVEGQRPGINYHCHFLLPVYAKR